MDGSFTFRARRRMEGDKAGWVPLRSLYEELPGIEGRGPKLLFLVLAAHLMKGQNRVVRLATRDLANLMGTSIGTVRKYARSLEDQGLLQRLYRSMGEAQNDYNDWLLLTRVGQAEASPAGSKRRSRHSAERDRRSLDKRVQEVQIKLSVEQAEEARLCVEHCVRARVDNGGLPDPTSPPAVLEQQALVDATREHLSRLRTALQHATEEADADLLRRRGGGDG